MAYPTSILVTGGTQGMGYWCTLALAKQRPNTLIVISSRTDPDNSAATINKTLKQSNVKYMPLDLGSLGKVRSFVQQWQEAKHPPIEALVLNAGLQLPGDVQWNEDGIEKTFAINHVGHALLFHLLAPSLTKDARIVITSSGTHDPAEKWGIHPSYTTAEECAKPNKEAQKKIDGRTRYANSKLANVLWMYALARRLASSASSKGKTVVALDPGLMLATGLVRDASIVVRGMSAVLSRAIPLLRLVMNPHIQKPETSGEILAWLAIGEEVNGKTGVYYEGKKEKVTSELSRVEEKQEDLWRWTVDFIAKDGEEKERFERLE